uniref:Putative Polysaccharide export protein n=1 Tax=Magnetococcus massalia (strain MO-1) TaxID=451514 RepID=A0A1S7LJD8_MAGMO|nr:putative Polysaccharide export protein [Candidatus Magnetococcus massalia]
MRSRLAFGAFLVNLLSVVLFSFYAHAQSDGSLRTQYRLGPGDEIQIIVNDEPDLTTQAKVGSDGNISYAFIGELRVQGLTPQALERRLKDLLLDGYLKRPIVSVTILNYRMLYVNGEVNAAGGYPYRPGLTVRKVVSLAGGFTDRADRRRVTVIRGGDASHTEQPIGLDDPIYPDDIVTVPEGFW